MSHRARRRRLSAVPIIVVIGLLLVGTVATTLALPPASPPVSSAPDVSLPPFVQPTAPPTETPLGRYPASAEAGVVTSCVSGIDPATVPGPIAQAFCVCTLN